MTDHDASEQGYISWSVRFIALAIMLMGVWFIISHLISWFVFRQHLSFWSRCFQLGSGLLHIACGIGLFANRNWARRLFVAFMLWHVPTLYKTTISYAFRMAKGYSFLWYVEAMTFLFLTLAWLVVLYGTWTVTRPLIYQLFRKWGFRGHR